MSRFKVALVDDHVLLRNGLANLVQSFASYSVLFEAAHGRDLIEQLTQSTTPDIVLLDINMPEMDGYDTALWLKKNFPEIKVLALSMYDTESSIIRMLRNGARGYLLKDIDPPELKTALDSLVKKGFYYSEAITGKLIHAVNSIDSTENILKAIVALNEKEIEFIKLACTELTYKEIAERMNLSPRTIDGYRDTLFEKLNVKTRVGLAMYAIKNGIVTI
jgi:two-component system invasion response regulator UvrY